MKVLKESVQDTRYLDELPEKERKEIFEKIKNKAFEITDSNSERIQYIEDAMTSRVCDLEDFLEESLFKEEKEDKKMTLEDEKRNKRINRYRKILNLGEDVDITEDNLDEWALRHTAMVEKCNYDQLRAELLGQEWNGY